MAMPTMPTFVEVLGAYGRKYKTGKEMKADWEANKDFLLTSSGSYINKEDAERYSVHVVGRFGSFDEKLCTLRK